MSRPNEPHGEPIRVALFNPIFAHYRQGLLRELLARPGLEVSLFADSEDPQYGIPAIDLSHSSRYTRTRCVKLFRLTWQAGVGRASLGNYDVYIFLGSAQWLSSWIGALIARLRGRRVLFWTHGWNRHDPFAKGLIRNTMYRLAHGLLLYGERAKTIGIEQGFDTNTLHVMYNSLDFDRQQEISASISDTDCQRLRSELFGDAEIPVVIGTARLTGTKRFDLLIRALGLLGRSHHRVNLILVGDGPQREELESLARAQSVNAAFIGACYDERRLAEFFRCANVTVSPGNVGLTCMHSMGYGVPVITHNEPDDQMPEWEAIAPGATGELFEHGSIDSLARAIDKWTQSKWPSDAVREQCLATIRQRYHPLTQCRVIEHAIAGKAALNMEPSTAITA